MSSVVMDRYDALEERQESSLKFFSTAFGISQIAGALAVVFMAALMGGWDKGFAWSEDPERQFNYHPLFMTIGMVFLYGEAILVYRAFRYERKRITKLLHGVLQSMVIVFVGVALKAVFDSHNLAVDEKGKSKPIANLYSLHSWLGLGLFTGFLAQYVLAVLVFVFPGGSEDTRARVVALHRPFGLFMFVSVSAVSMMGMAEHAAFHIKCLDGGKFCSESIVANLTGICILAYICMVALIVGKSDWQRRPLPEENMRQMTSDD